MKERPLPFSAAMIRAVQAGTKTETRRTRGLDRIDEAPDAWKLFGSVYSSAKAARSDKAGPDAFAFRNEGAEIITLRSPYGVAGDKLWFREAWRTWIGYDAVPPSQIPHTASIWYEADGTAPERFGKLRPAMFMCRWMSRKSATVVASYPERLHDIAEGEARAEGAIFHYGMRVGHSGWRHDDGDVYCTARASYFQLWNKINGPGSAAKNPWIWVTKFEVTE